MADGGRDYVPRTPFNLPLETMWWKTHLRKKKLSTHQKIDGQSQISNMKGVADPGRSGRVIFLPSSL